MLTLRLDDFRCNAPALPLLPHYLQPPLTSLPPPPTPTGKTRDIVNGLRSVAPLADKARQAALQTDLAAALQKRQTKIE